MLTHDGSRRLIPPGEVATTDVSNIVWLQSPEAKQQTLVGAKAARLAEASAGGLPVLPGFVVPTTVGDEILRFGFAGLSDGVRADIHAAWAALSARGTAALVVRSSSPSEDGEASSMAGRFVSVLDVRTWTGLVGAIEEVVGSSVIIDLDTGGEGRRFAMAVLVQPQLDAVVGGVMFGVDPITGSRGIVVAAARSPEEIVSGRTAGSRTVLGRHGRVFERAENDGPRLTPSQRRRLAHLAGRARQIFAAPQDNEWAIDADRRLWLLQSRPLTAIPSETVGPVFGPGPCAETFPVRLRALEEDLWIGPLGDGMRLALHVSRAVPRRRLAESSLVVSLNGWIAIDIELLGIHSPRRSWIARLDPRPPARRLAAAWRTGRLRAALPGLATDLVGVIDGELAAVPALAGLSTESLLDLLERSRKALVALHAQEVLAGMLLADPRRGSTSAGVALVALHRARIDGMADADIVLAHPEVLALSSPRIGGEGPLPTITAAGSVGDTLLGDEGTGTSHRESLRLRIRWTHELTARVAFELGRRLTACATLEGPEAVAALHLVELREMLGGAGPPDDLATRLGQSTSPLPAAFRFQTTGKIVPLTTSGTGRGTPAGAGRWSGPVTHEMQRPSAGAVLVVRSFDPALAPLLPMLGGIVSETGSPLSHLAILARELGIPAVVGVEDALTRFPDGTRIFLDGSTGEVRGEAELADVEP